MDKSLWQTLGAFDLLHSSHMWIQAILLCGKHSTTMQIRIVSRLWFCRRPWRFEIYFGWNIVHFRKSHVRTKKLDVQETDFSFTQFHGSWNLFLSMQVYAWMRFPLSIFGIEWLKCFIPHQTKPNQQNQRCKRGTVKPVGKSWTKHAKTNFNHEHQSRSDQYSSRSIKRNTIWFQWYVVCLWGQWAVIKMIIKGRSPTLRHVSRTHRDAWDWLFDRIILDSEIQIRYIDTKHQLADMLTKCNFTRDEWNNLLHLFNNQPFQLYLLR